MRDDAATAAVVVVVTSGVRGFYVVEGQQCTNVVPSLLLTPYSPPSPLAHPPRYFTVAAVGRRELFTLTFVTLTIMMTFISPRLSTI